MSRLAYTLILTLALPLLILRLLWRSLRLPAYRERLGERFAISAPAVAARLRADSRGRLVWIHAVSVGEVAAAEPLVRALLAQYPDLKILLTTMTPTGAQRAAGLLGARLQHCYVPYDLPILLRRFVDALRPDLAVLMETELWPNLIHVCAQRQVPMLLANGRLSAKSAQNYHRIARVARQMLSALDRIAAQSQDDADRFVYLGANEHRVTVTGSLKFTMSDSGEQVPLQPVFAALQSSDRPIVIAASTREGEEEKVLDAFAGIWQSQPQVVLLLVPRHPQRFEQVARLCLARNLGLQRRSDFRAGSDGEQAILKNETKVLLGDSMGEMPEYFRCADIAFVGGSLVNTGCQNVLEPAALGIPVLTGPSQFNFAAICRALEAAGALLSVQDETMLSEQCLALLADAPRRRAMGEAGRALVAANQQALPAHLQLVAQLLE